MNYRSDHYVMGHVRDVKAWLGGLSLDFRLALRMLVRYPLLTIVGGAGLRDLEKGMTMKRVALTVILIVSSSLAACRQPAADATQDEGAVRQVFDTYIKSVNTADVTLASSVWLQSPELVAVTPFGRFEGWERVREEVYVKFLQQSLSERNLQPSNVSLHVMGDSAWLAFDWAFTGKLTNGPEMASKGWESHVYRKTDQGWRIVHLHYSVPPPLPPSPPTP